jgi:hypothetical protein
VVVVKVVVFLEIVIVERLVNTLLVSEVNVEALGQGKVVLVTIVVVVSDSVLELDLVQRL